jgi:nucleotide-binding universal stress UspA family protein
VFDRIIVPLDGSKLAERALAPALHLAKHFSSTLILLTVPVYQEYIITPHVTYGAAIPEGSFFDIRADSADYLDALQRQLQNDQCTIETRIHEGDAAGAIIDSANAEEADLIVMSTHGRSGMTRWLFGSVTEKVMRQASCAVLVVRSERPIQQVLIPLDGSKLSESALQPGLACAQAWQAYAALLNVVPSLPSQSSETPSMLPSSDLRPEGASSPLDLSMQYVDGVAQRFRDSGVVLEGVTLVGSPSQSILEYSELHDFDLIAMATHGHTGLRRWMYGSVTEKVLRGSQTNLLIVHPLGAAAPNA